MYKLAVFDLDGTLLDTLKDLADAANVALKAHGFELHEMEAYKTYVGNGVYKLIERSLPKEHRLEETIRKVKSTFDAYYKEHSLDETKPYEGIVEMLEILRKEGVHCCVVSNKPHAYTKELVALMFGDKIEKAYGQREGIPPKPDPVSVLAMLEYFQVKQEESIYIGDSDVDIYTAKNAGLTAVGVLWGFRTEEELKNAGADYLVGDMETLKTLITGNTKKV